jgi:hypothetical protein
MQLRFDALNSSRARARGGKTKMKTTKERKDSK